MRVEKPLRGASPVPSKAGHAATDNDDHGDRDPGYDSRHGSAATATDELHRGVLQTVEDLLGTELSWIAWLHVV